MILASGAQFRQLKPATKRKIILFVSGEFGDDRLQIGNLQVGINRRGLEIAVAQQSLNVPDAGPTSEQVRRAAVPAL
jgi:hypothetical protein